MLEATKWLPGCIALFLRYSRQYVPRTRTMSETEQNQDTSTMSLLSRFSQRISLRLFGLSMILPAYSRESGLGYATFISRILVHLLGDQ
jgi:hypothetical protein